MAEQEPKYKTFEQHKAAGTIRPLNVARMEAAMTRGIADLYKEILQDIHYSDDPMPGTF